ncbi:MAG TPA: hypothetical protein VFA84_14005 [Acidimicrobiales bacterium]|nr:hypothetical protein [Acidimicrobiales bacterium]
MRPWFVRPALPEEHPPGPLPGYKLAHALVSTDGSRAAFVGLVTGARQVYGAVADGVCVWNHRHVVPKRGCGCGFYCFHTLDRARAMACDEHYRATVLLEVAASGRFIRYEEGLRYARQRVRAVRLGRCSCGAPAEVFVESGRGLSGWRRVHPACRLCSRKSVTISRETFARRLGGSVPVVPDEPAEEYDVPAALAVFGAEVALLQARLDEVQRELARIGELERRARGGPARGR